ncbi:DNA-processing protein DprA [uncultured Tyzzerella sp.]|uniref:DNA-processing protein DprA n=1 Tax=uncultured Tyzzerella sp. TaxID=2321398 RepID=UPI0029432058|nr:DNA-processing protein DprA [uncultured Tyzzerella sp.]
MLEDNFIMWLSRIDGISIKKKWEILNHFKTAKDFFYADVSEIRLFCNKNRIDINNILDVKNEIILENYINHMKKYNFKFVSQNNKDYPNILKQIPDAPLGFYMLGNMPDDLNNKVGVIGARKCTQYGAMNAYKFGKELGENNIVVVSGMAMGIDSMAHKGAIDGGGKTIAVLGCGLDIVYPPSNLALREDIIKNGCVISEFPIGTPPYPANFPMRNRIISGMSDAILVVESGKKSGTLITVGQALEQGRDIFAIPGNINSPMSEGTNNLIKECAFPLTNIDDILSNLGILHKYNKNDKNINNNIEKSENIKNLLAPDEKIVYACIQEGPVTIDEIIVKAKINIQTAQYVLTMLELKGYIKKLAGQKYIKAL